MDTRRQVRGYFYFRGKNEITHLDDEDLKTFAVVGEAILRIYHRYLGITNVNIVMRGSVKDCRTEPLQKHFVPRVNLAAMYEILGVDVVDTFPQSIAAEFRRAHVDPSRGDILPWYELFDSRHLFDPEAAFHASGLNLVVGAHHDLAHRLHGTRVWQTAKSREFDSALLQHGFRLGWEHINLTGDYTWQQNRRVAKGGFSPL